MVVATVGAAEAVEGAATRSDAFPAAPKDPPALILDAKASTACRHRCDTRTFFPRMPTSKCKAPAEPVAQNWHQPLRVSLTRTAAGTEKTVITNEIFWLLGASTTLLLAPTGNVAAAIEGQVRRDDKVLPCCLFARRGYAS